MKKLMALLACILLLTGCSSSTKGAKSAFIDAMLVVSRGNSKEFFDSARFEPNATKFVPSGTMNPSFYSLGYVINSVDAEDEKTVILNVDITAIDFCAAYTKEYLAFFNAENTPAHNIFPVASSAATNVVNDMDNMMRVVGDVYSFLPDYSSGASSQSSALSGASAQLYGKLTTGATVPFRTTTVDITMKKIAGEWRISMDKGLARALTGYSPKENYSLSYNKDFQLDFSSSDHSWFLETAATTPKKDSRWKLSVSFLYDLLIGVAVVGALVYGVFLRRKKAAES